MIIIKQLYKTLFITTGLSFSFMANADSVQHIDPQQIDFDIYGSVKLNYSYANFSESSKDKLGDLAFESFILGVDAKQGKWGVKAEYNFSTNDFIKYGYGYYQVNEQWQLQLGVNKVPFGSPDYISNSYWFSIPYYMGFEDDRDVGFKAEYKDDAWATQLAFYKGAEYKASENKRYAADLYTGSVNGTEYNNEEVNQINYRQTYTVQYEGGTTELGGSVQVGQIYNALVGKKGDRLALAAHIDSRFNQWRLQLQAIHYEFDTPIENENKIALSLLSWQYEVADKGQIYDVNLSRKVKTSWGSINFYNDFSFMTPDVDDASFDNTIQNILGAGIAAGPTYTWVDFVTSKNMTFASPQNDHIGLPQVSNQWDKRLNINTSYRF